MVTSDKLLPENEAKMKLAFDEARPRLGRLANELVDPGPAAIAIDQAEVEFAAMLPGIAYRDHPDHPHAADLFACAINLALFLALKNQGVDEHQFGRAMLLRIEKALAGQHQRPTISKDSTENSETNRAAAAKQFVETLKESERSAKPGEFVYEYLADESNPETGDWAFNIKSCAICHHFQKYDAMGLVPYMCASDDVVSDAQGRGLARTGTIALGASHCDFRYQAGGKPNPVADQYPDKIRLLDG